MVHPPHSTGKRVRGVIATTSFEPFKLNIRRLITSAGGPLTKGNSNAEEARKPACADSVCIKDGQRRQRAVPFHPKAALASCLAMIPPAQNSLSSHRHKQWGQLGAILGGVRFPESVAKRRLVQPPVAREVVSNRADWCSTPLYMKKQ